MSNYIGHAPQFWELRACVCLFVLHLMVSHVLNAFAQFNSIEAYYRNIIKYFDLKNHFFRVENYNFLMIKWMSYVFIRCNNLGWIEFLRIPLQQKMNDKNKCIERRRKNMFNVTSAERTNYFWVFLCTLVVRETSTANHYPQSQKSSIEKLHPQPN